MVSEHHLSERRACRLVGLSRDSYRNLPEADNVKRSFDLIQGGAAKYLDWFMP